ncbi:uncharacterized protein L969DRAFT_47776 [Mixia osmundae IAM 14324]|uniref:Copper transport protein n=1 Tax=Mixia osmundae (strain CBS 9802 / IAM 14324 / JCM 22182 / KY 12970) TaxID=764103 RepID=G7E8T9_MIXOS|nr:uncharacterized protein L969DRAFT_47776 [Mixia osmundae IAM 14324]KEI40193.1 hypothetical protein L969DRAFT_47776 [Mixia osmundae IAM 14324]GAA99557.1 hypothetical protein E5Q_06258 [Mixia osmundae IAM 14324]
MTDFHSSSMDMSGMSAGGTSSGTTMMSMGSFAFRQGGLLWFPSWQPTSIGGTVGACFGLLALAVFSRFLSLLSSLLHDAWSEAKGRIMLDASLERHYDAWTRSVPSEPAALGQDDAYVKEYPNSTDVPVLADGRTESLGSLPQHDRTAYSTPSKHRLLMSVKARLAASPPFVISHEMPRAVLFAFHAGIMYLLMIAVMTMNAGYFLSVLAGLGLGEMLFGRYVPHHLL